MKPSTFAVALFVSTVACFAAEEYPKVISVSPAIGATDVDPATKEIRVIFDQDMAGGMSWTGGGENYPELDGKPNWADKRTCVLPVKLVKGKFYRVGINASSFRNFQSEDRVPAQFAVIYFTTAGADQTTLAKLSVPKVVSLEPANDAKDVPTATTTLKVTFSLPMGGGMSWTKSDGLFPPTVEGGRATWNDDKTVCELPVTLAPGTTYTLGLNAPFANNFQTAHGVPLPSMVWTFTTAP